MTGQFSQGRDRSLLLCLDLYYIQTRNIARVVTAFPHYLEASLMARKWDDHAGARCLLESRLQMDDHSDHEQSNNRKLDYRGSLIPERFRHLRRLRRSF